jgi:hypothetical protein
MMKWKLLCSGKMQPCRCRRHISSVHLCTIKVWDTNALLELGKIRSNTSRAAESPSLGLKGVLSEMIHDERILIECVITRRMWNVHYSGFTEYGDPVVHGARPPVISWAYEMSVGGPRSTWTWVMYGLKDFLLFNLQRKKCHLNRASEFASEHRVWDQVVHGAHPIQLPLVARSYPR